MHVVQIDSNPFCAPEYHCPHTQNLFLVGKGISPSSSLDQILGLPSTCLPWTLIFSFLDPHPVFTPITTSLLQSVPSYTILGGLLVSISPLGTLVMQHPQWLLSKCYTCRIMLLWTRIRSCHSPVQNLPCHFKPKPKSLPARWQDTRRPHNNSLSWVLCFTPFSPCSSHCPSC